MRTWNHLTVQFHIYGNALLAGTLNKLKMTTRMQQSMAQTYTYAGKDFVSIPRSTNARFRRLPRSLRRSSLGSPPQVSSSYEHAKKVREKHNLIGYSFDENKVLPNGKPGPKEFQRRILHQVRSLIYQSLSCCAPVLAANPNLHRHMLSEIWLPYMERTQNFPRS